MPKNFRSVISVVMLALLGPSVQAAGGVRQLAITIDDVDVNADDVPTLSLDQRNDAILDALQSAHVKAAIFVCGMRVDNKQGRRHIAAMSAQGHIIANHTFSHFAYPKVGFETFAKDTLRGEDVIRDYAGFRKLFRFPYLKEGDTAEQRDRMRQFMADNGYRNGYVTIDASDWAIDARLRKRLRENPHADLKGYRAFYLEHIGARADFYDRLAADVIHRPVKHTLLIHHNLLAALFLKDLIEDLKGRGWQIIDASEAYEDPISLETPHSLPAGEGLIYALAKDSGKYEHELRYPAEDGSYEEKKMNELGL